MSDRNVRELIESRSLHPKKAITSRNLERLA